MIIPSIDLQGGRTVQLVQGERLEIDAGDPLPIAKRFGLVGETAVIDLDAAMGTGGNESLVRSLLDVCPCRVGGGIRSVERARMWLDAGARKVILGTAASPEILRELPRERLIAALDARDGEIVVQGWKSRTGLSVIDRMRELRPYVSGFLVTFVETEGTLAGLSASRAKPLLDAAGDCRITVAGGVRSADEIGELDAMGIDAQVGMALYKGLIHPADAIAATLRTDRPDGLWPTVVTDERGVALGLAYSSRESLREAIDTARGVYWSRERGLWRKGESSGNTQELLRVDADCDRDTLRFTVRQQGPANGFCHLSTRTCWGPDAGLAEVARRVRMPRSSRDEGSYTSRLLDDPALLSSKILEEAREFVEAADRRHSIHEAADLLYFVLVRLAASGIDLAEIDRELTRRALKVSRRPGNAKPVPSSATSPASPAPPSATTTIPQHGA
jgi:phosphoribosyl-ATP pyrophosphohydrolase